MRGNPLLRAGLLAVALCLTGLLLATVLAPHPAASSRPSSPDTSAERHPTPHPPPTGSLVPAFLTVTLSAPATSISFREPSGRRLTLPATEQLTLATPLDLTLSEPGPTWEASLSISWQDPSAPRFIRLDLEPHQLPTATLVLNFPGDVSNHPLTATFAPDPAP